MLTSGAEYVGDDGKRLHGRADLTRAYAAFFAKRPALKVESRTTMIRFLSKDAAVEEGLFTVLAKNAPQSTCRFSTLYVRQDGRWKIAMLKEWNDETTVRPHLADLAWLIGSWEADGPEQKVVTTYQSAQNKKFIRCDFKITQKKDSKVISAGTQVIGVDPAVDTTAPGCSTPRAASANPAGPGTANAGSSRRRERSATGRRRQPRISWHGGAMVRSRGARCSGLLMARASPTSARSR